jgi:hypothetical protein
VKQLLSGWRYQAWVLKKSLRWQVRSGESMLEVFVPSMLRWISTVGGLLIMMGQHAGCEALFYYFRLEDQIPESHLLGLIDKHISFEFVRQRLKKTATAKPGGRRLILSCCCACFVSSNASLSSATIAGGSCISVLPSIRPAVGSSSSCGKRFRLHRLPDFYFMTAMQNTERSRQPFDPGK